MNSGPLLHGIFDRLRRDGLPLGVRDYLDALHALQAGYGTGGREALRRLCEALWARREEDLRAIRMVFAELPYPSHAEVSKLLPDRLPASLEDSGEDAPTRRPTEREVVETPDQPAELLPIEFVPETAAGGIDIPRARAAASADEPFVFSDRPQVSMRDLALAWRRFRRPLRTGPPVELDLEATVQAQCRTGLLPAPVLVPARRNQATLVVLFDVSVSMLPWQGFDRVLSDSLRQGQLGKARVYYFSNLPADPLYGDRDLLRPASLTGLLRRHSGASLLVVSDAGAARGRHRPARVRATADFAAKVRDKWHPLAWVNPMPTHRWRGTSAGDIAGLPGVGMSTLTEDGVVQAMDYLRGYAD